MNQNKPAYACITPVKDEALYIRHTLESMTKQRLLPMAWIIVDDGSSDDSAEIISEYASAHPWIRLVTIEKGSPRQTGSAEIYAFNYGLTFLKNIRYDFIVKLDADVSFEEDYFSRLISKFISNPRMGIASGIYLERHQGRWQPIRMPGYHAAGASKVIRSECFRDIGGFMPTRGWDTVDEIKALYQEWETGHFIDLPFYHLKAEGSGMGFLHTSVMHGEIFYRTTGGFFFFFLLKVIKRLVTGKPFLIGGAAMMAGYWKARLSHMPLLVTREEAAFYRGILFKRLWGRSARSPVNVLKAA